MVETMYLIDDHRVIDGRLEEVFESNVLYNATSNILAGPCFDPGAILRVRHLDVPEELVMEYM